MRNRVLQAPTDWEELPLKALFKRTKELGNGSEELLSIYRDYGVIPKASRNDNFNTASEDLSKYQLVRRGDLVVNKMKAWQGSVAISKYEGIISPAYFVYRPRTIAEPRFLHYLLRSQPFFGYYASISSGVRPNQWDLDPVQFEGTLIPIPNSAEQRAIADYLDHETAELDALIDDLDLALQLLKESLESFITESIWTPSVDSLTNNQVRMVKLRHLVKFNPSPTENVRRQQSGAFRLLPMEEINYFNAPGKGQIKDISSLLSGYSWITPGDVAYAKVTPCFENGKGINGEDLEAPVFASTELTVLRPNSELTQKYLSFVLQSSPIKKIGVSTMTGAGGLKRVPDTAIANISIPLPGVESQRQISDLIDSRILEDGCTVEDLNRAISFAKERRAALITAAVTGQVDVRAMRRGKSEAEKLSESLESGS